jgi:hypothetical protein
MQAELLEAGSSSRDLPALEPTSIRGYRSRKVRSVTLHCGLGEDKPVTDGTVDHAIIAERGGNAVSSGARGSHVRYA